MRSQNRKRNVGKNKRILNEVWTSVNIIYQYWFGGGEINGIKGVKMCGDKEI